MRFSQFICFCKPVYMFQTGFPSIVRSSKLHIQRQACVRPLLLPVASRPGKLNEKDIVHKKRKRVKRENGKYIGTYKI